MFRVSAGQVYANICPFRGKTGVKGCEWMELFEHYLIFNYNILSMNYILSKRIINTPLEKLYEAYSNPDILIKWWGPHGFSNKFNEFTFAENGLWDYIMIDELGVEYHNQMIFKEIYPNKKIVADHISDPAFRVEIEFLKITSQQSEVFFKMKFEDDVVYNALKNYVPEKNEENFERLENILK